MRVAGILSALALATAVIAAPTPRPSNNDEFSDSTPMDPGLDLESRDSITVSANPEQLVSDTRASLADLKNLAHGASDKAPVKIAVTPRGDLSSLLDPLTSTLDFLFNKLSVALNSISSAAIKISALLPANINNADQVLDDIAGVLSSVQPDITDAVKTLKKGDVQGLLSKAGTAGTSNTASQVTNLVGGVDKLLTQVTDDLDAIAGLGITADYAKIKAITNTVVSMLAQIRSASGTALPL